MSTGPAILFCYFSPDAHIRSTGSTCLQKMRLHWISLNMEPMSWTSTLSISSPFAGVLNSLPGWYMPIMYLQNLARAGQTLITLKNMDSVHESLTNYTKPQIEDSKWRLHRSPVWSTNLYYNNQWFENETSNSREINTPKQFYQHRFRHKFDSNLFGVKCMKWINPLRLNCITVSDYAAISSRTDIQKTGYCRCFQNLRCQFYGW